MRRAFVVVALLSCQGTSDLQLADSAPPGGETTPVATDPNALLAGDPYLSPLSGHRLAARGQLAVVSDPEGANADGKAPQVFVVNTQTSALQSVTLPDGARPGAIELTADGATAWVALEGSGGVAAIDTKAAKLSRFVATCRAPIDLALAGDSVWVACMSGEVVKVSGTVATRYTVSGVPSRIAAVGSTVFVALADASLVELDASGQHAAGRPPVTTVQAGFGQQPGAPRSASPNTPRRLLALGSGVTMLHQQSLEGELIEDGTGTMSPPSGMGGGSEQPGSPYSGGGLCPTPATRGALTTSSGGTLGQSHVLATTLPIDAAVSGTKVAIADPATGRVTVVDTTASEPPNGTIPGFECIGRDGNVTEQLPVAGVYGVTFDENGRLLALSAGTALKVTVFDAQRVPVGTVTLRGRAVPTGFNLFHASPKPSDPATPNVACASCHPAGLANGGTLTISGVTHKVMSLGGHQAGVAGVHWDNHTFEAAVLESTWKTNMQGRPLTASEGASLKAFVEQLRAPKAPEGDAARVALGKAAFDRAGCGGCHDPSHGYTNNSQADVGRGMHRVPSLIGLVYSAPYMSDGCAKTLSQRFTDAACGGGTQHGNAAVLSSDDLDALQSFLKTL